MHFSSALVYVAAFQDKRYVLRVKPAKSHRRSHTSIERSVESRLFVFDRSEAVHGFHTLGGLESQHGRGMHEKDLIKNEWKSYAPELVCVCLL